jgi:Fe2+ or Zn2+ uptake regulation protein
MFLIFLFSFCMDSNDGGWPSHDKIYQDLKMNDVRYNLATFYRKP